KNRNLTAGGLFLALQKRPPKHRLNAHDREEFSGDAGSAQVFRLVGPNGGRGVAAAKGAESLKSLALSPPIVEVRIRCQPFALTLSGVVNPDHDDLPCSRIRKRPEQYAVDNAEDRRIGADAE